MNDFIIEKNDSTFLTCWIQPNASKTKIVGEYNNCLKIAISAPPTDGKANKEVCLFLSKLLSISKSSVKLISGETNRKKVVSIKNIEKALIIKKLFQ